MAEHTGTFIEIEKTLYRGIKDYCGYNGLKVTAFINEILQKAFMKEKYGEAPPFLLKKQDNPLPDVTENTDNAKSKGEIQPIITETEPKKEITTPKGKKKIKVY